MAPTWLQRVVTKAEKADTWPPKEVREHWFEVEGYRRRYRNDRAQLVRHNPNLATRQGSLEHFVPVPWPRELCRFSAALLFSVTPRVTSKLAQDNLEVFERINDIGSFATDGGEQAACDGRIGIRVIQDDSVSRKAPLLTIVPEDQIIWDLRHGRFYMGGTIVITRKVHQEDRNEAATMRMLETHQVGSVERRLYKGDEQELGKEVPLTSFPEFADLKPTVLTGLDKSTLIPWQNVPGARSDLFGLGPLFDEVNEAESLLLARGRQSQPRTFVDRSLVDETGTLKAEGYIITGGSRMQLPLGTTPTSTIATVQPQFYAPQHIAWADHVTQLLVTCAGYAPDTWGIQGKTASIQRAVSGYAMKLSQLRTLLTRSAKEHMALEALGWSVATGLAMMAGASEVDEFLPSIELGDGLPNDPLDGAQEVLFLRQATAASTEELVKTVHPTWTSQEVQEEAQRIMDEGAFAAAGAASQGLGAGGLTKRLKAMLIADDDTAGGGIDSGAPPVD